MKPIEFPESNHEFKKPESMTDEQCITLPCHIGEQTVFGGTFPVTVSCWALTPEDLEEINRTGRVWVLIMSHKPPPMIIQTTYPFDNG